MIRNYFVSALRNLLRYKVHTALNILGLALGIACFLIIYIFVNNEFSYDKHHKKYKRIYRVESDFTIAGKNNKVAKAAFPMGPALKREFPQIEEFTRISEMGSKMFRYEDKEFFEDLFFLADSTVFNIFDYHFISGDPGDALTKPNSLVITESVAKKYFGHSEPLGKVIKDANNIGYKITGVIEDLPVATHIKFDALLSFVSLINLHGKKAYDDLDKNQFMAIRHFTYILLTEGADIGSVHDNFQPFHEKYIKPIADQLDVDFKMMTTPLEDIHLYSKLEWDLPGGSIKYVKIFALIGVLILLIACVNYVNMATACSAGKSKEIGLRKIFGASRKQLMGYSFFESFIMAGIAIIFAIAMTEILLPNVNELYNCDIKLTIQNNPLILVVLGAVLLLTGMITGLYPATYLASFEASNAISGSLYKGRNAGKLRKLLIVIQFSISIIILIGTMGVSGQLYYLRNKSLGYNKENIVSVEINDTSFVKTMASFKNELYQNPNILKIASVSGVFGQGVPMDVMNVDGEGGKEQHLLSLYFTDPDFVDLMGIEIVQGRNFDENIKSDNEEAVIINESTVKKLGWHNNAIGKRIQRSYPLNVHKVIGVVRDFHFTSLHNEITPLILFPGQNLNKLLIRIDPENQPQTLDFIREKWEEMNPSSPFNYNFLDNQLKELYESEEKLAKRIAWFSVLAIIITILGLIGLSSYMAEQSTIEVGIRKVLGASHGSIVKLLSLSFLKLILLSIVIGSPVAWYFLDSWFREFAFSTPFRVWWFIISGVIVLVFAQASIIWQTIKASRTNPAEVLKC